VFAPEICEKYNGPAELRVYPKFATRLQVLYDKSRNMGWGYSYNMGNVIVGLQEEFGGK